MLRATRFFSRYGLTLLLASLLVWLQLQLWMGRGGLPEVWRMQKQLVSLNQQISQAKEHNANLKAQTKDLKEGVGMVEDHARLELGMVKPNEILVQYHR